MRLGGRPVSPYPLYLVLECGMSFLLAITYTTVVVYWVVSGHLDPLQLLLLGTTLELTYFLLQLPTGVLADLVSRRLFVLAGLFVLGLALIMQSLSPAFGNVLAAQVVGGAGYAMLDGALQAWIADELGEDQMTSVYLRATQLGLIATIAGSLLSGVIALAGPQLPLRTGGIGVCLLALGAAVVMPERNFRPAQLAGASAGPAAVVRQARQQLAGQARATRLAVVAVPGLVLLFAMTAFAGVWSESFDRLWGAFLLTDIRFPSAGGLHPATWFSLLACAVSLLALGSTEVAKRRSRRLGPDSVVGALLGVTAAIGVAVVAMALSRSFLVAVAAYLFVSVLRPVSGPLLTGWLVGRVEPSVRATTLSAQAMFDSGGQIAGGPVIGLIGNLASIRIALIAGAAALGPAVACIAVASHRIRPRAAATVAAATAEASAESP